jgi:acetylornithine/succinyldiaminopimelate/putrescine aminotransferase
MSTLERIDPRTHPRPQCAGGSVVRWIPPLTVDEGQIDAGLSIFADAPPAGASHHS